MLAGKELYERRNSQPVAAAAPRNRSSLHRKLKIFSLSPFRTLHVPNTTDQQSPTTTITNDSAPGTAQKTATILDLPVELILSIIDFLPPSAIACLALTCHHLAHYIGTRIFTLLDTRPSNRFEKATFLQKLQKDRPDPNLWLCYACLRFHATSQRYEPANFRAVAAVGGGGKDVDSGSGGGVGFPNCRSIYGQALEEITGRLSVPQSEWTAQVTWMEDDITSPVRMDVYITCRPSSTELLMRRRYRIDCRPKNDGRGPPPCNIVVVVPVAQLLDTLGMSNLEICPHICFARDWCRGDGSVMGALKEHAEREHWNRNHDPMFQCRKCGLEMEVRFQEANAKVILTVWQHVGRLAAHALSDQQDDDGGVARVDSLEPAVDKALSKSRTTSSLLRLPKSWTTTLEDLKKRRSSTATLESPPEPSPAQSMPPSLGEIKEQWESLERENYAQYLLLEQTARTALKARE